MKLFSIGLYIKVHSDVRVGIISHVPHRWVGGEGIERSFNIEMFCGIPCDVATERLAENCTSRF